MAVVPEVEIIVVSVFIVPDVSVADPAGIAEVDVPPIVPVVPLADVSVVDIVELLDVVSVVAVAPGSVAFAFCSFLHANARRASAAKRMRIVFFMFPSFLLLGFDHLGASNRLRFHVTHLRSPLPSVIDRRIHEQLHHE